jgi:hypothetical protein
MAGVDQGGVLLEWEDHSLAETGFEIERRRGGFPYERIAVVPADTLEYFDAQITVSDMYSYRIRAFNPAAGPSAYAAEVTVEVQSQPAAGGGGGGGGCFIATAAYGSQLHPKVVILREFRDRYLLTSTWGRHLVAGYYRMSPPLASVVADNEVLRGVVRGALKPVIWVVEWLMEGSDEDQER